MLLYFTLWIEVHRKFILSYVMVLIFFLHWCFRVLFRSHRFGLLWFNGLEWMCLYEENWVSVFIKVKLDIYFLKKDILLRTFEEEFIQITFSSDFEELHVWENLWLTEFFHRLWIIYLSEAYFQSQSFNFQFHLKILSTFAGGRLLGGKFFRHVWRKIFRVV